MVYLRRGRGGGVFNLEKTMASVLHKDLQYNVDKLKYKKIGGHAAEDQKQILTFSSLPADFLGVRLSRIHFFPEMNA